ncbi:hypothetical protein KI387_006978, partial [Taxus chinensis]
MNTEDGHVRGSFSHGCERRAHNKLWACKTGAQEALSTKYAHAGSARPLQVGTQNVTRLCERQEIVTVNGMFPGPTLHVHQGDNLLVRVENKAPYNITIHWHGVRQLKSCWADGPEYITQCPITPGNTFTYNFSVPEEEGTVWWHAHASYLRATVHGALIIYPRIGKRYPFRKPVAEVPIILGTFRFSVRKGKTYLLRIISAVLNEALFFKIAGHRMTVVAVDALYTKPYKTDVVLIYPGQTTDALLKARKSSGRYYIATRVYNIDSKTPFNNSTATAILQYNSFRKNKAPLMPSLPEFNDTPTAFKFSTRLRSLRPSVPLKIDEEMLITAGLGLHICPNGTCTKLGGIRVAGAFNNISFVLPDIAILQAYYYGINGVFTTDFPNNPPLVYDYTAQNQPTGILFPEVGTKVKVLKFNSNVQIVLQATSLLTRESHPIHIHGFDFYVVGQGFGNYNPKTDPTGFNLIDPQQRNTIGVPSGGWAAIRFKADNP